MAGNGQTIEPREQNPTAIYGEFGVYFSTKWKQPQCYLKLNQSINDNVPIISNKYFYMLLKRKGGGGGSRYETYFRHPAKNTTCELALAWMWTGSGMYYVQIYTDGLNETTEFFSSGGR